MGVAAVVGIYAGVAAGLFVQAIRFTQILIFGELRPLLQDPSDHRWAQLFGQRLLSSRWHFEFAVLAALLFAFGYAVEWLGERRKLELPLFEARRVRAVAEAGALGLSLYYPLVVLRAFNGAFDAPEGGLYEMLVGAPRIRWVLAPALGALLAGLLVRYVSPESAGHGVVEVIEAIHLRGQKLRGRVALWKALAAGVVIGSGGSAGREGPVVHIGGAVAASLGRSLALPRRQTVLLIACGAGAGIAASFQAPFAGTLFALEIVIAGFAADQIAPVVLACVTATVTSRALLGGGTDLKPVTWTLAHPSEIGVYLLFGVVAGLCGVVYVRSLAWAEGLFEGSRGGAIGRRLSRLSAPAKGALGGFAVGLAGLLAPRALGTGIESMNAALGGELALGALCLVLLVKLFTTAATLGSGSPGGSFFPAVFLGAMLGGAFGHLAQSVAPGIASAPSSYAAVGMGAVVAGATVAPLTGVMMMVELTGSWQIAPPLLISCCTAAAVVQGVLGGSIYQLGARRRGLKLRSDGPALSDLSVAQALERGPPAAALLDDARLPRLYEDDDLEEALRMLTAAGATTALVLADDAPGPEGPLGIVTRQGILDTWQRMAAVRSAKAGSAGDA
jgi:CIC family chloride channel protein